MYFQQGANVVHIARSRCIVHETLQLEAYQPFHADDARKANPDLGDSNQRVGGEASVNQQRLHHHPGEVIGARQLLQRIDVL